jgi:hypothetical protein
LQLRLLLYSAQLLLLPAAHTAALHKCLVNGHAVHASAVAAATAIAHAATAAAFDVTYAASAAAIAHAAAAVTSAVNTTQSAS